ncbi:TIGR02680 family protein, partial [Paenibacillus sp. IB182496]
ARSREPEPPRSEARRRTRAGYTAGAGAPLYEACEFLPHIGEAQRAAIELTLLGSGALDAWLRPDGRIAVQGEHDEESWIVPQPIEWGYTLADVLRPTPPAESGLTAAQVEAALRSFAWGEAMEPVEAAAEQGPPVIGTDHYRFGPLAARLDGTSHRAQYIGREARRRFQQAEIARLGEAIAVCDEALAALRAQIGEQEAGLARLERELAAFPLGDESHEALLAAWSAQYEATTRFRLLLEQERKQADQLRVKQQQWSELKQAFIAATAGWTRLKTLRDLQEALRGVGAYLEGMSQLVSDWREYRQHLQEAARCAAEARELAETAELEEERRDELLDKQYGLKVKAEQLRKLMEELGIGDLYSRLSALKTRRRELDAERDRLAQALVEAASRHEVLRERQRVLAEREQDKAEEQERRRRDYFAEWERGLVPETGGRELTGAEDEQGQEQDQGQWLAVCQALTAELERLVGRSARERLSGTVQDHYNASKQLLAEYVLEIEISEAGRITLLSLRDRTRPQQPSALLAELGDHLLEQEHLLSDKDRELFEEIILRSVGKSIRQRIQRAELWLAEMNRLMAERDTSSGLKLQLQWVPRAAQSESELNSDELVQLLRKDAHLLHDDEVERLVGHFRSRVQWAKQGALEEREALRKHIYDMLDYRSWFQFALRYKKGGESNYRELTDARFNVLSGGEKAMSMYIPLFAATYSRYADASAEAPKIISLDEAFAGVDDENIRDLFGLLTEMDFDYMMTSQVLWGCYDTVPRLGICEIYRPKDADFVTVFRYRWDGRLLESVAAAEEGGTS